MSPYTPTPSPRSITSFGRLLLVLVLGAVGLIGVGACEDGGGEPISGNGPTINAPMAVSGLSIGTGSEPFTAAVIAGDAWSFSISATSTVGSDTTIDVAMPTGDALGNTTVDLSAPATVAGQTASKTVSGTSQLAAEGESLSFVVTASDSAGDTTATVLVRFFDAGPQIEVPTGTGIDGLVGDLNGPFTVTVMAGDSFSFDIAAFDAVPSNDVTLSFTYGTGGSLLSEADSGLSAPGSPVVGNPISSSFSGTWGPLAGTASLAIVAQSGGEMRQTTLSVTIQAAPSTYDPALLGVWVRQNADGSRADNRLLQLTALSGDTIQFQRTEGLAVTVSAGAGGADQIRYPNFVSPAFSGPPSTFTSSASGGIETDRTISVGETFDMANPLFGTTDVLTMTSNTAGNGIGEYVQTFGNGQTRTEEFQWNNFTSAPLDQGTMVRSFPGRMTVRPSAGEMDRRTTQPTTNVEFDLSGGNLTLLGTQLNAGGAGTDLVGGSPWTGNVMGATIPINISGFTINASTQINYEVSFTATDVSLAIGVTVSIPANPPFYGAQTIDGGGLITKFEYQTLNNELLLHPIVEDTTYTLNTGVTPNTLTWVDLADDNAAYFKPNSVSLGLTTARVIQFNGGLFLAQGGSAEPVAGSPWVDQNTMDELTFATNGTWTLETSGGGTVINRGRWIQPGGAGANVFYAEETVWQKQ